MKKVLKSLQRFFIVIGGVLLFLLIVGALVLGVRYVAHLMFLEIYEKPEGYKASLMERAEDVGMNVTLVEVSEGVFYYRLDGCGVLDGVLSDIDIVEYCIEKEEGELPWQKKEREGLSADEIQRITGE